MSDATPSPRILDAIRAETVRYHILAAEAIDNAVDAGARRIDVVMDEKEISITDDGEGFTRKSIGAAFRLGDHAEMMHTKIGRYGVGIKWQALNAGDLYHIQSTSKDGTVSAILDWSKMKKMNTWEYDDPIWSDLTALRTGTRVSIAKLRQPPRDRHVKNVLQDMARRFRPALVGGLKLTLNGQAIPCLPDPEMKDVVEGEVWIGDKGASLRAGILVNPAASGFHKVDVIFAHRVIHSEGIFGVGTYSGIDALYARINLLGPWTLDRFKEKVEDEALEDIEGLVHEKLLPILEKCQGESLSAHVEEIQIALNEMLPEDLQPARPPRKEKRGVPGDAPQPGRQARPHGLTELSIGEGPARQKKQPKAKRLQIEFEDCVDKFGVGHFIRAETASGTDRVCLAKDCEHIKIFMASRDKPIGLAALYNIVMCIYLEHVRHHDGSQARMADLELPFGRQVWLSAQRQKVIRDEDAA